MIKTGHYHLTGVAGVGMSALAQAMAAAGCNVSGSDRYYDAAGGSEVIRKLCAAGVRMFRQDGSGILPETRAVVISTAIEEDNPDLLRARELNVKTMHRSEALSALLEGQPCIAVTGTCGKSTVTGMIGCALECLGADPVVINGAPVLNWRDEGHIGNMRWSNSSSLVKGDGVSSDAVENPGWWVVEADESDRSLLNIHPDWVVITNVSKDHFSIEESMALFCRFREQAGVGVISMIDEQELLDEFDPRLTGSGSCFRYKNVEFSIGVPGRHNAENALCAVVVCERLGYGLDEIGKALGVFRGVERRLERVGESAGVTVIDDYAHNPEKIRASWLAMIPHCARLHCVWRPHGYGPLRSLMNELVAMFVQVMRPDDRLFVLPVYDAGGSADRTINSDSLVDQLRRKNASAFFVEDPALLPGLLADGVASGDIILTMGARDPDLPALARRILAKLQA